MNEYSGEHARNQESDADQPDDRARGVTQLRDVQKQPALEDDDRHRRAHDDAQRNAKHLRLHEAERRRATQQPGD